MAGKYGTLMSYLSDEEQKAAQEQGPVSEQNVSTPVAGQQGNQTQEDRPLSPEEFIQPYKDQIAASDAEAEETEDKLKETIANRPANPFTAELNAESGNYLAQLATYMSHVKPETPEEIERRKRSMYQVEGIGHLGNALSALSNLWATSKGAPSQTLPQVPGAYKPVDDMRTYQQKLADKYLEGSGRHIAYLQARHKMFEDEQDSKLKPLQALAALQSSRENRAYNNAYRLAQLQGQYPLYRERFVKANHAEEKASDEHARSVSQVNKNNRSGSTSGGGSSKRDYSREFVAGGKTYIVDFSKIQQEDIAAIRKDLDAIDGLTPLEKIEIQSAKSTADIRRILGNFSGGRLSSIPPSLKRFIKNSTSSSASSSKPAEKKQEGKLSGITV